MNKFAFAARHGMPSLTGWTRAFFHNPSFSLKLFCKRWDYFFRRKFDRPLQTIDGFDLETPDALVTYWLLFIERELHDSRWIEPLKTAVDPFVVDVGANAGLFSHMIFCLNHRASAVAFEPLSLMNQKLNNWRQRMDVNLDVRPKAVGRNLGEAIMESPHGYDGISRICVAGQPTGKTFRVPVTTLDQELAGREVFLVKIDVEGYECEVLAGAKQTLAKTRFLIVEAHTTEHRDAITAELGAGWSRKKLGPSDYLFCKQPSR